MVTDKLLNFEGYFLNLVLSSLFLSLCGNDEGIFVEGFGTSKLSFDLETLSLTIFGLSSTFLGFQY